MPKLQEEVTTKVTPPPFSGKESSSTSNKATSNDYTQLLAGTWKLKKPIEIRPVCLSFDHGDMAYLVRNLTLKHLKNEIKTADIEQGVARMWAEDADVTYWQEFGKVCQRALESQRADRPVVEGGKFSIQDTKKANNIIDVICRYTELKKAGKEHAGRCPFHEDTRPSLRVSEEKQLFHCFSCLRGGDVISFIMQMQNLDLNAACRLLAVN